MSKIENKFTSQKDAELLKILSGDLNALLANCDKEDLDPLVSYISDRISSSIETNEIYKKYNPDHTKYTDLIAKEIRLYGGNTVSNLTRGGDGPTYDEILIDVCNGNFQASCRLS